MGVNRIGKLSSRAIGSPPENTEVSDDGIQALVSRLKALGEDVWIVGGAKTIRAFLDHDAVDRIELFVIPVLIGSGLPLFERSPRHARLSLEETQSFPCGVVMYGRPRCCKGKTDLNRR